MDSRTKASLLWGLVGTLSFLVLAMAARALFSLSMSVPILLGVAVPVFFGAALLSHVLGRWLDRKRSI
ncbi:MAG: hypothetical protein ABEJ58_06790 [Halodesulfurarchaeum sp.]